MTLNTEPSERLASIREVGSFRYSLVYEEESESRQKEGEALVVLVPGVPGSERDFRHLAPLIACWSPVVRIVFPGFGLLNHELETPSSTDDRGQYLMNIAEAEGWGSIFVIGHSMGGIAAMQWAQKDKRVKTLVLMCSVGVRRHRGMSFGPKVAQALLKLSLWPLLGSLFLKILKGRLIKMGFGRHPLHHQQLGLILRHVRDFSFEGVSYIIDQFTISHDRTVGVIYTLDDPIVDLRASRTLVDYLSQKIPKKRLCVLELEQGGHNPQKHNRIEIDRWLNSLYNLRIKRHTS